MFYFDEINGKKILKSDFLQNLEHFFTTRETVIKSAEVEMQNLVATNKKLIKTNHAQVMYDTSGLDIVEV